MPRRARPRRSRSPAPASRSRRTRTSTTRARRRTASRPPRSSDSTPTACSRRCSRPSTAPSPSASCRWRCSSTSRRSPQALGGKRAEMADPAVAERKTGYVVGGISPIGQKTRAADRARRVGDPRETIFVSGGRRGLDLELAPDDLIAVTGGRYAPIAREPLTRRTDPPQSATATSPSSAGDTSSGCRGTTRTVYPNAPARSSTTVPVYRRGPAGPTRHPRPPRHRARAACGARPRSLSSVRLRP